MAMGKNLISNDAKNNIISLDTRIIISKDVVV
jgi:hypothetical protein